MKEKQKILIVEDKIENLIALEKLLDDLDIEVIQATSGKEALAKIIEHDFALVLLDVQMPEMDGYETLELIRQNKNTKFLPIILVSAINFEKKYLIKGIERGAIDFIIKPIIPEILLGKVSIFLNHNLQRRKLEEQIKRREDAEKLMKKTIVTLQNMMSGIMKAISLIVEARDPYTAGHQDKVAEIALAIADELGLSDDQIDCIGMAATIHDLGKINVPVEILSKPGKIDKNEFNLIKLHPKVGYDILKTIEFPWPIAQAVFQHHERLDGSGYPNGLSGNDILIESKIISVADVVEAISSHRPYRATLGIGAAMNEITEKKGILYDSDVVDACIGIINYN